MTKKMSVENSESEEGDTKLILFGVIALLAYKKYLLLRKIKRFFQSLGIIVPLITLIN